VVASLPLGDGLCARRVRVERARVAWLRYVLEAHEGLAFMHSDGSGVVSLLTTESQREGLDALITDLEREGVLEVVQWDSTPVNVPVPVPVHDPSP
jgi:hypothetical protein